MLYLFQVKGEQQQKQFRIFLNLPCPSPKLYTIIYTSVLCRYVSGPGTKKSWYRVHLVTTSGREFTLVIEVYVFSRLER